tara:strand:+ start:1871 stop:2335 length:465 start_codon:yes stop_codon:yes gene_type:complete
MSFKLSQRSLDRLDSVDPDLIKVVKYAIGATKIDFGVIEGVRTLEKQKELVAVGASKTMNSKHLKGLAVDLMAYVGGRGCWELKVYDDIADAMKQGAIEHGVPIVWGASWHIRNIADWEGTMEEAMNDYIDTRRKEGKRPFIDGPHFEINSNLV